MSTGALVAICVALTAVLIAAVIVVIAFVVLRRRAAQRVDATSKYQMMQDTIPKPVESNKN